MTVTAPAKRGSIVLIEEDGTPQVIWGTGSAAITTGEGLYLEQAGANVLVAGSLIAFQWDNGENEVAFPAEMHVVPTIVADDGALRGIWLSGGSAHAQPTGAEPNRLTALGECAHEECISLTALGECAYEECTTDPVVPLESYMEGADDQSLPLGDPWSEWLVIDGVWSTGSAPGIVHGVGTMEGSPVTIRIDASPLVAMLPEVDDEFRPTQVIGAVAAILGGNGKVTFGPTDEGELLPAVQAALEGSDVGIASLEPAGNDLFCTGEGECVIQPDEALAFANIEVFGLDG